MYIYEDEKKTTKNQDASNSFIHYSTYTYTWNKHMSTCTQQQYRWGTKRTTHIIYYILVKYAEDY